MGYAFHMLCPRYSGPLAPPALSAIRLLKPLSLHKTLHCASMFEGLQYTLKGEAYYKRCKEKHITNKASQAIQSPRTVPFFLLVSLLDGYSFPNVLVKGIVAFKH